VKREQEEKLNKKRWFEVWRIREFEFMIMIEKSDERVAAKIKKT
jgi:hypothetical protein